MLRNTARALEQEEAREYVTLPQPVGEVTLARLLNTPGGAALHVRTGADALGRVRTVLTVTHPDGDVVAWTRQNLLRACQEEGVRAFVV